MKKDQEGTRSLVARAFTWVEDIVYVGLGTLLAASALLLLGSGAVTFTREVAGGVLAGAVIHLLDRLLLTLMIVELLYTVQVSFREHTLVPEPFLIVGLIATVRRLLVLTAEFARFLEKGNGALQGAMLELGLLTVMIVALVGSLVILRKRPPPVVVDRT